MTIQQDVWPNNQTPGKDEIERMYKCAYYLDRGFLKPSDVTDFGIDISRLKEWGEVVMKKPLPILRAHVKALWDRMDRAQRTMFLYSYFAQGMKRMLTLLDSIEAQAGNCMSERHAMNSVTSTLPRKFPEALQDKIREGFGKEWSV